jgi:uncharacterized protein (DUF1778 family)
MYLSIYRVDIVYTSPYSGCTDKKEGVVARALQRDLMINLRASRTQRSLIDRAAEAVGKNRSDFMLEAACREADSVLLDRRLFVLDEREYAQFTAALDRSPADNPRLTRLLRTRAPWEK